MQAVILCGGQGTRLREETEYKPKPMVTIGGKPILWHIMQIYAYHGVTEFILALGFKGHMIRDYFLNSDYYDNDFTISLGRQREVQVHRKETNGPDWKVTLVETGENAMTGARVKKCEPYVEGESFFLTYGDGLADVDINRSLEFHKAHKKLATLTGVRAPSRFGEIETKGNQVVTFREKPRSSFVNGGFFVFNQKMFRYLSSEDTCVLEHGALEEAARDGELMMFPHEGFWQCMDTYRDYLLLNNLWAQGMAPWILKKVEA